MTNGEQEARLEFEPVFVPESEIIIPLKRAAEKPSPSAFVPPAPFEKVPLILNIETEGLLPWNSRIIAIGLQDPAFPNDMPTIIMEDDEAFMLNALFTIIKEFGYNQLVGYGLSFDFRFIVVRAMKHGITCKEFVSMDIYDLGQAMAQVKFQFVYFAQKQPALSDIAEFFWGYPKPFTDLEMLKYWKSSQMDKVVEFTSSQITRILLLYYLFRNITETSFVPTTSGIESVDIFSETPPNVFSESKLTIPEAHLPETWLAKCPFDLSEWNVPITQSEFICPIDGTIIKKS